MDLIAVAFGLLGLTLFWGLGFAVLTLPPGLRKYSWLLAPSLGLCLQTFVVWVGVHVDLEGTNAYGFWALVLPAILLLVVIVRRPRRKASLRFFLNHQSLLVGALAIVGLLVMISPMLRRGLGLTTVSVGSCDPPDYAEGARAFQEFAYHSKIGFLGQPDVHGLDFTGGFYGYWVRLNHFGPAAVIALDSTLLGLDGDKIISLVAFLFCATAVPLAYVLARVWFRYKHLHAFLVAAAFAFAPAWYYAAFHGALGQLIGSQGAVLTLISVSWIQRSPRHFRAQRSHLPLAIASHWLVVGSYPIMLVFAYGLLGLNCMAQAWIEKSWRRLFSWVGFTLVVFSVCVMLFPSRFLGIETALKFFGGHSLGWPVPTLNLAGLYGCVGYLGMEACTPRWNWSVGAAAFVLLGWALRRGIAKRDRALVPCIISVAVILAGYYWLNHVNTDQNLESYKAYKLLAVFYPAVLASLLYFLRFPLVRRWAFLSTLVLGLLAVTLSVRGSRFMRKEVSRHPCYFVSPDFEEVKKLDQRTDIVSVNFLSGGAWVDDLWTRLWCSTFLMHKRQYFSQFSYLGRTPTDLRGTWDIIYAPDNKFLGGIQKLTINLYLMRHGKSIPLSIEIAEGWWDYNHNDGGHWAGATGKDFSLRLRAEQPTRLNMKIIGSPVAGDFTFEARLDGKTVALSREHGGLELPGLSLSPGEHKLVFTSQQMPVKIDAKEPRLFLYKLVDIQSTILSPGPTSSP